MRPYGVFLLQLYLYRFCIKMVADVFGRISDIECNQGMNTGNHDWYEWGLSVGRV